MATGRVSIVESRRSKGTGSDSLPVSEHVYLVRFDLWLWRREICGPRAVPAPLNVSLFLCCLTAGNGVVRRGHMCAWSEGKISSVVENTQRTGVLLKRPQIARGGPNDTAGEGSGLV